MKNQIIFKAAAKGQHATITIPQGMTGVQLESFRKRNSKGLKAASNNEAGTITVFDVNGKDADSAEGDRL